MGTYVLQRVLLMIPTLLGIMAINFFIVHLAPGGPLDYVLSRLESSDATNKEGFVDPDRSKSQRTQATDDELVRQLKERFEFHKPLSVRFFHMVKKYVCFDLGQSYFKGESVGQLIASRLPVSISIGLWSLFFTYLLAVPLGILKATKDGSAFDTWSSILVILGYAVPSFLFGMLLIIFFAGGTFWSWFPLKGLFSESWDSLSWWGKVKDYFWHLTLPLTAQVLSSFGALTLMVKNSFYEELRKPYVLMSRAQGMTERKVLTKAVFRNAILVIVSALPSKLLLMLFSSSLLIETIFSLEGLGLLGYEALLTRDYPIIFGSLYVFTLIGLVMHLISDLLYAWIDPRIDLSKRQSL